MKKRIFSKHLVDSDEDYRDQFIDQNNFEEQELIEFLNEREAMNEQFTSWFIS